MRRCALAVVGVISAGVSACGGKILQETLDASPEHLEAAAASPYAAACADAGAPPSNLECTGLYTDVKTKAVTPGVYAYAPAVPLWADGSDKQRWIGLPPGTKIDATDPNEWRFPVGTRLWKEFSREGKRIETRLWQKTQPNYWVRATYQWNADESVATISSGGNIAWGNDGGFYHIPTQDECDQCHRGRADHILGFEQVSLGLDGATGLTLSQLVAKNLITPAPAATHLVVGDDGTGVAAAPLKWIHVNCGVSCHNNNANSTAYGAGQLLRLDPTMLDGRSSSHFDTIMTTVNVMSNTPAWAGYTRIVPGDPTDSLLVQLISNRGTDNPVDNQMPPIATYVVDEPDTQSVVNWISRMTPNPTSAGSGAPPTQDAGRDATVPPVVQDAGVVGADTGTAADGSSEAAGSDDASAADETESGAQAADAGVD